MKKKNEILTFLGALAAAFVSTLINKLVTRNEIRDTVQKTLEEERRQILAAEQNQEVQA